MRPRPAVAAAALLATLTACGSTVQQRSTAAGDVGDVGLGGTTGLAGPGSSSAPTAAPGVDSSGGPATPSAAPRPQDNVPSMPPGGELHSGPLGTAPGVTATTIKIGIYTAEGFTKFASQFGANIATGDQVAQAKAVIKYLNAHGGMAGRTIVPVFHDLDTATATANIDTEYQSACATWTQDNRVYAVVTPIGTTDDNLYGCLSKAGVVTVSAGDSKDETFFQRYANWFYEPTDMNLRRILSNEVDGLFTAGFFGAHPKIGVVHTDTVDETAAVNKGLRPALARHGLTLADTFAAPIDSSADAAYSSAVLRFQTEGITHVLFTSAASPILFMQDASSQQYYPRYGLQSKNSPSTLQTVSSPTAQRGAMGIGWQPMNDVDGARDPGRISSRQALCLKLMKEAGENTSSRSTNVLALWFCDNLFFLHDALLRAPSFTVAGLRQGAESLTSFQAASTFRSRLGPGLLHDGASAFRVLAFKDDCKCYQYVSPLRPAS